MPARPTLDPPLDEGFVWGMFLSCKTEDWNIKDRQQE